MSKEFELANCRCGEKMGTRTDNFGFMGGFHEWNNLYYVGCPVCGKQTPLFVSMQGAVDYWNEWMEKDA